MGCQIAAETLYSLGALRNVLTFHSIMQHQVAFCRVINIMSPVNSAKPRSKAKVPQCSICQQLRTGPHEGWEYQRRTKAPASWTDILTQTRQTIREIVAWMGIWVREVQTESWIKSTYSKWRPSILAVSLQSTRILLLPALRCTTSRLTLTQPRPLRTNYHCERLWEALKAQVFGGHYHHNFHNSQKAKSTLHLYTKWRDSS